MYKRQGGDSATAVKWWRGFLLNAMGESEPGRVLDVHAPLQAKLDEELLIMEYATWLVQVRRVTPATARAYVSTVQCWHERRYGVRLAGNLVLGRLPAMLKGMENAAGGKQPRRKRRGVTPGKLAESMAKCIGGGSMAEANWRAALQGGGWERVHHAARARGGARLDGVRGGAAAGVWGALVAHRRCDGGVGGGSATALHQGNG